MERCLSYLEIFFSLWWTTRKNLFVVLCSYLSPLLLCFLKSIFVILIYHYLLEVFYTAIFFLGNGGSIMSIYYSNCWKYAFHQCAQITPVKVPFLILSCIHSPGNSYSYGYPEGKTLLPVVKRWLLLSEVLSFPYETNSQTLWLITYNT